MSLIINPYRFGNTDPFFASVVSLLHFDGTDGSTTFTDVKGLTWTPMGNAQIDTAISKFGGASGLFDGNNDGISATNAGFAVGTGDFTAECWIYRTGDTVAGATAGGTIIDFRTAEPSVQMAMLLSGSGSSPNRQPLFFVNGANRIIGNTTIIQNAFRHLAFSRVSGTTRMFVDGIQSGSDYVDANNYTATTCFLGQRFAAVSGDFRSLNGNLDDFRFTAGVGRYTSAFTPPSSPFPNS